MKLKITLALIAVLTITFAASCKIQEAPGAYAPAKGERKTSAPQVVPSPKEEQPKFEEQLKVEPVKIDTPAPAPKKIEQRVDTIPTPPPAPESELTPEPILVSEPEPVVEPILEPIPAPAPEPVQEVTRKEKFVVVVPQQHKLIKKYSVVIGSFGIRDNAERLCTMVEGKYTPVIVKNDKGMFRVIAISYDDYASARREIQLQSEFPDAWVLVNQE